MEIKTFFFDTYAFFEMIEGNKNYDQYLNGISVVTTKLNLMELFYGLLKNYDEKIADEYYDELIKYTIEIDDDLIKKAMIFRLENKKKDLSYTDCLGYVLAKERNILFLTGDNGFKDLPNVEFVK